MFQGHKVVDAHCHIYPEKIAHKAVDGIGAFYDLAMHEKGGTAAELLAHGTAAGIDTFMVFSVATKPSQVTSINEFIAQQCREHANCMAGLGTIHPLSADMTGDILRIMDLGLKGIKIHPDFQEFKLDDYRFLKAYELCSRLKLPFLIHTGDYRYDYSNPNRMKPILACYPDVTFIGAHFGGWSMWETAAEELNGYKNFYVDCSSSFYHLDAETALRLIRLYGAEKVLFGTDYPMWQATDELAYLGDLDLTREEREQILHLNAEKIFKL